VDMTQQLNFQSVMTHTTDIVRFYEQKRADQLTVFQQEVRSTLDDVKKSISNAKRDQNVAEANRLIGAAHVLDPSVRVSRSTDVSEANHASITTANNDSLSVPYALPSLWKDESYDETLYFEMVKVWIEEVMPRIVKVGGSKWYVSHSNSSNKALINSQRKRRSDFKKLYRGLKNVVSGDDPQLVLSYAQTLDTEWNNCRKENLELITSTNGKLSDLQTYKGTFEDLSVFRSHMIDRRMKVRGQVDT